MCDPLTAVRSDVDGPGRARAGGEVRRGEEVERLLEAASSASARDDDATVTSRYPEPELMKEGTGEKEGRPDGAEAGGWGVSGTVGDAASYGD